MDKLERYHNYIVDDLKKDTVILYDYYELSFPWDPVRWVGDFPHGGTDIGIFRLSYYKPSIDQMKKFAKYVMEKYGAREEEAETIYNLYREKYAGRF